MMSLFVEPIILLYQPEFCFTNQLASIQAFAASAASIWGDKLVYLESWHANYFFIQIPDWFIAFWPQATHTYLLCFPSLSVVNKSPDLTVSNGIVCCLFKTFGPLSTKKTTNRQLYYDAFKPPPQVLVKLTADFGACEPDQHGLMSSHAEAPPGGLCELLISRLAMNYCSCNINIRLTWAKISFQFTHNQKVDQT